MGLVEDWINDFLKVTPAIDSEVNNGDQIIFQDSATNTPRRVSLAKATELLNANVPGQGIVDPSTLQITIDPGNTTVSISSGKVNFVRYLNGNKVNNVVEFPGVSNLTPDFLTEDSFTAFGIDEQAQLVQANSSQISILDRISTVVPIGGAAHVDLATIQNVVGTTSLLATDTIQNYIQTSAGGPYSFNDRRNNEYTGNTDLTLNYSGGIMGAPGVNRFENPSIVGLRDYDPEPTVAAITGFFSDGVGGVSAIAQTEIDPTKYDDGSGTLATLTAPTNFTNQFILRSPETGLTAVLYGTEEFAALDFAINEINKFRSNPVFDTFSESLGMRTALSVQGTTTNLQAAAQARFTQASPYGDFA